MISANSHSWSLGSLSNTPSRSSRFAVLMVGRVTRSTRWLAQSRAASPCARRCSCEGSCCAWMQKASSACADCLAMVSVSPPTDMTRPERMASKKASQLRSAHTKGYTCAGWVQLIFCSPSGPDTAPPTPAPISPTSPTASCIAKARAKAARCSWGRGSSPSRSANNSSLTSALPATSRTASSFSESCFRTMAISCVAGRERGSSARAGAAGVLFLSTIAASSGCRCAGRLVLASPRLFGG
mmetsp:Transcript_23811/g.52875  ORF Transcript_23811/g.52875 Transcript_23811/m.52875 type:complete len:241 (-) Transcript_23811:2692-3414(-)